MLLLLVIVHGQYYLNFSLYWIDQLNKLEVLDLTNNDLSRREKERKIGIVFIIMCPYCLSQFIRSFILSLPPLSLSLPSFISLFPSIHFFFTSFYSLHSFLSLCISLPPSLSVIVSPIC